MKQEEKRGKKHAFSVGTVKRVYFMYSENEQESLAWIKAISATIDRIKSGAGASVGSTNSISNNFSSESPSTITTTSYNNTTNNNTQLSQGAGVIISSSGTVRNRLKDATQIVSFFSSEEKVSEFWNIWYSSIPTKTEGTSDNQYIDFNVSVSADMQKISWRCSGPQNLMIQKMVDFFWNVGAPENEIDRLNDVGALINPNFIGSWINMSSKGGMDGGWYFPVLTPIGFALETCDGGEPSKKISAWATQHDITHAYSVSRDMGAAPPRQSELKFQIPGDNFQQQLEIALSAFSAFNFPALPQEALDIINSSEQRCGIRLSLIVISQDFVQIGLLLPSPDQKMIDRLCPLSGASSSEGVTKFASTLGASLPSYVEFQYLKKPYGYGVYKEGFDVVFHYEVCKETF